MNIYFKVVASRPTQCCILHSKFIVFVIILCVVQID